MARRKRGIETYDSLADWYLSSADAERMTVQLLAAEGFSLVNPSQPLGGPDGLKDVVCMRGNERWIAAVHFARKAVKFSVTKAKFLADFKGVRKNNARGFAFFTNQKLTMANRKAMERAVRGAKVEIYHLERIAALLNQPINFALRWEYLDIDMNRDEFISFLHQRDTAMRQQLEGLLARVEASLTNASQSGDPDRLRVPLHELQEFKRLLDQITSVSPWSATTLFGQTGSISALRVPLQEMKEFARLLAEVTGQNTFGGITITDPSRLFSGTGKVQDLQVPLERLKEFASLLGNLTGHFSHEPGRLLTIGTSPKVQDLNVPLVQLKEYETILERILQKAKEQTALLAKAHGAAGS